MSHTCHTCKCALVHSQACTQATEVCEYALTVPVSELRQMTELSSVALVEHMQAKTKSHTVLRLGTFSLSLAKFSHSLLFHYILMVCLLQANIFSMAQTSSTLREIYPIMG